MGVLDDAIREHLDLKRARGGDPAEIERMEREALGPVRREPTIGSTRFDSVQEPELNDEHLAELEDPQELGYNDSTAPHPHHEHVHPDDEHLEPHPGFDDAHLEHLEVEEPEQPKRRFLRRNRPTSLSEPVAPDAGLYEEPPTEHHDLLAAEHHDLLDDPDPLAHEAHEPDPPAPSSPPPSLQFDSAPKRPRFTAEPPELQPEAAEEPEPPVEPVNVVPPPPPPRPAPAPPPPPAPAPPPPPAPAPPPPPAPAPPAPAPPAPAPAPPAQPAPERSVAPPADGPAAQETTEFDVEKHIAEAPHEDDDDVLEETPEFLQDTPEHDRLWFEQRPPKDFDFDG